MRPSTRCATSRTTPPAAKGHAIAAALAGRRRGPSLRADAEPDPLGVRIVHVESAREMLAAVPGRAAGRDRRLRRRRRRLAAGAAPAKMKKPEAAAPKLALVANPDILTPSPRQADRRPRLVIGFAAETGDLDRRTRPRSRTQGLRLDPRQRRLARDPYVRPGRQPRASHNRAGVEDWGRRASAPSPTASPSVSPIACRSRRHDRSGSRPSLQRLPHGEGLPLPGYATEEALEWTSSRRSAIR